MRSSRGHQFDDVLWRSKKLHRSLGARVVFKSVETCRDEFHTCRRNSRHQVVLFNRAPNVNSKPQQSTAANIRKNLSRCSRFI